MSDAQIKAAAIEDLPAIRDLAAVIWRAHYPGIISREQIEYMLERMYAIETLREEIQTQSIRFERILWDGTLVGFAAYGPLGQSTNWKLHKLYLLPQQHGKGLGSQLLRHCEVQAHSLGAQRMLLSVNKHNARAIATYQRNAYAITESVCLEIGNGFVMDDFVMTKSLA